MEKIGTRLRLERERRGWTRLYVADAIDSDLQNIGRWERGETFPSPYYRQRLCSLFQMDAEALGLIRSNVRNSAGEMQEQITEDTQEHDLDNRPFSQHLVYPASQEDENLQTEEAPAPTWEGWRETTIPVPLQPQNLSKERRPFPSRTMIFIGIGLVLMVATLSWLIPLFWRLLASSPASSPYTLVTQPANSSQPVSSPITGTVTRQAGDSAAIVATSRPSTVRPNERFTIFFIVINNGNTIRSDVGKYRLTCIENCMGGEDVGFGSQNAVPGQQWQFTIHLTAPNLTGTYSTTWVLEHNRVPFGPSMSIPVTVSIRPGGIWVSPDSGQTVGDIIQFTAHAYRTEPEDPAIDHVNFTVNWQNYWKIACVAYPPATGDIFTCNADLRQLGVTPGQIRVSFDVYDVLGNFNKSANGVHSVVYSPGQGLSAGAPFPTSPATPVPFYHSRQRR